MSRALITGITGQDGSYLAEFLLGKGYQVFGMVRNLSTAPNTENIQGILDEITLLRGDLTDSLSIHEVVRQSQPDEVYNLASQSHVGESFKNRILTADVTGTGALRVLDAVRRLAPQARFYQASSSEMYGFNPVETPQSEKTPFNPSNYYAVAKLLAHCAVKVSRKSDDIFGCCGILFNHESPRRGREFVTRKAALAAAKASQGKLDKLPMGNLTAVRDWGYAPEYVEAMWMMLQQGNPDDYVIATGVPHTVEDLLEAAFSHVGLAWQDFVEIDPKLIRPLEAGPFVGDATKAREVLGWKPRTSFEELVALMADAELARLS